MISSASAAFPVTAQRRRKSVRASASKNSKLSGSLAARVSSPEVRHQAERFVHLEDEPIEEGHRSSEVRYVQKLVAPRISAPWDSGPRSHCSIRFSTISVWSLNQLARYVTEARDVPAGYRERRGQIGRGAGTRSGVRSATATATMLVDSTWLMVGSRSTPAAAGWFRWRCPARRCLGHLGGVSVEVGLAERDHLAIGRISRERSRRSGRMVCVPPSTGTVRSSIPFRRSVVKRMRCPSGLKSGWKLG